MPHLNYICIQYRLISYLFLTLTVCYKELFIHKKLDSKNRTKVHFTIKYLIEVRTSRPMTKPWKRLRKGMNLNKKVQIPTFFFFCPMELGQTNRLPSSISVPQWYYHLAAPWHIQTTTSLGREFPKPWSLELINERNKVHLVLFSKTHLLTRTTMLDRSTWTQCSLLTQSKEHTTRGYCQQFMYSQDKVSSE